ncbi:MULTISPECIES: hypothetical protein [unclassified Isoptericola]|uniref:hypothetical protein n=1 Tax=unclassified Isoptericola TaxID=2623355 RepID=UPI0036562783
MSFPDGVVDMSFYGRPLGAEHPGIVPIILSGATKDRNGKPGPYFSGQGISTEIGKPSIGIADPTITDHDDLKLAWYTGCHEFHALDAISALLRGIADRYDLHLLLVGGSGGGYAALRLVEDLRDRATAFVWNPQTDILMYEASAVASYVRSAFPELELGPDLAAGPEEREATRSMLRRSGVDTIVGSVSSAGSRTLVLQNVDDWQHTESHVRPYASRRGMADEGAHLQDARGQVAFGNWGVGHIAPPRDVLVLATKSLLAGHTVDETYAQLLTAFPAIFDLHPIDMGSVKSHHFALSLGGGELRVSYNGPVDGFEFAYYFNGPHGRLDQRWYTDQPDVVVPPAVADRTTSISCFVRNTVQAKVRFEIPVPVPVG